ncbi:hypothetical protein [Oceanobacillus senegalensis]|uniref:hypothetical protein n=1 Tax=Oceanobacillus senegalensis TaxID=1936063 RepID=UPI001FE7E2C6|nr:hypothetical protein [Oceanobacillus senegalensis]
MKVDYFTSKKDNASVINKNNIYRGDSLLNSSTRPNGVGKPYILSLGDLVPSNKHGFYKGRQVTVTEHILGGTEEGLNQIVLILVLRLTKMLLDVMEKMLLN